jgi:tetratricopeptide (TPR) repeat protein
MLRQALTIRERTLGPGHPDVAANLDRLGALYVSQKRYDIAASTYERSVFIWTKALGAEDPELARKFQALAEVYAALDRPSDAEPLVRQVLTARERDTVESLNTLAGICAARDNNNEADLLYRQSLGILDKRGLLSAKRPFYTVSSDATPSLLVETAEAYVELLKKMRRKGDANKLEAKLRGIRGSQHSGKKT